MKEVDFAILDKTFAAIKGISLVQRMILGMTARFPKGNRYNNVALGEFFQDTPGTISHLITDLKSKNGDADNQAFIIVVKPQSPGRVFFLNPKHPALIEIAEFHKAEGWCKDEKVCCLHCYFQPTENNSLGGKQPTEKSSLGRKQPTGLLKTTNSYKGLKDITTREGEKAEDDNKSSSKDLAEQRISSVEFMTRWNSHERLLRIHTFTDQRKKALVVRGKEPAFVDKWRLIIDKIAAADFCTGKNDRGWKADVDWLLHNDTNYTKVLEGKYDNKAVGVAVADFDQASAAQRKRMLAVGENANARYEP